MGAAHGPPEQMAMPTVGGAPGVMGIPPLPIAGGSFDFGMMSPRGGFVPPTVGMGVGGVPFGAGMGTMMGVPGPDSHRSFAGALDGVGAGGDALDGFVVHSRFVRADAPIGEGEGGGLVPPGQTVDVSEFAAVNTRADRERAKQANLIGRAPEVNAAVKKAARPTGMKERPAWGAGGGGAAKAKAKPNRWK